MHVNLESRLVEPLHQRGQFLGAPVEESLVVRAFIRLQQGGRLPFQDAIDKNLGRPDGHLVRGETIPQTNKLIDLLQRLSGVGSQRDVHLHGQHPRLLSLAINLQHLRRDVRIQDERDAERMEMSLGIPQGCLPHFWSRFRNV